MASVIVFGSSIAQGFHDSEGGWADRLKRELLKLDKQLSFFNLGISGDRTQDVLDRFHTETHARLKRREDAGEAVIVIAIGSNDTYKVGRESEPNTQIDIFEDQLRQLLEKSKVVATQVLVCSILPFDESRSTPVAWRDISYFNQEADKYNHIISATCEQVQVNFVDLGAKAKLLDWSQMLDDGVHPNAAGHEWICQQMLPEIQAALRS